MRTISERFPKGKVGRPHTGSLGRKVDRSSLAPYFRIVLYPRSGSSPIGIVIPCTEAPISMYVVVFTGCPSRTDSTLRQCPPKRIRQTQQNHEMSWAQKPNPDDDIFTRMGTVHSTPPPPSISTRACLKVAARGSRSRENAHSEGTVYLKHVL